MSDDLDVKEATAEEASDIARIQVAAWHAAYRGIMPDSVLEDFTVERRTKRWEQNLSEPDSAAVTLVGLRADECVGFASYGPCRDGDAEEHTYEIWAIYVHPESWGTGVGRQLLETTLERLGEVGAETVTLWVLRDNHRARSFYEAAGFSVDGEEKFFERDGARIPQLRYTL